MKSRYRKSISGELGWSAAVVAIITAVGLFVYLPAGFGI